MKTVEALTSPALIPTPTGFHTSAQGRDAPLSCVAPLGYRALESIPLPSASEEGGKGVRRLARSQAG